MHMLLRAVTVAHHVVSQPTNPLTQPPTQQPQKPNNPTTHQNHNPPKPKVRLEGGVLNLVATQFALDRGHDNRLVFLPEQGLDPTLDVALASAELRTLIQGRASSWQSHVVLTGTSSGGPQEGEPLAAAEARASPPLPHPLLASALSPRRPAACLFPRFPQILKPAIPQTLSWKPLNPLSKTLQKQQQKQQVAKIFEGRLAETLLAADGQLSLGNLATSTFATLLPKIETQARHAAARRPAGRLLLFWGVWGAGSAERGAGPLLAAAAPPSLSRVAPP